FGRLASDFQAARGTLRPRSGEPGLRPALPPEGPLPGLPGGTPTRAPGEPGHPALKPGLLTRPEAPSGEPGRWSPRERFYRWSPRFDLGFGRLVSDFQAARGTLRPRSGEPGLRLR
ncbi:hypothetical protein M9458_050843, partial [Cirrhinus mrigala]